MLLYNILEYFYDIKHNNLVYIDLYIFNKNNYHKYIYIESVYSIIFTYVYY